MKSFHQKIVPFEAQRKSENLTLKKHPLIKVRYCRANQTLDMNRKLSNKVTNWSRLRNKILNARSNLDNKAYNLQRNYVVGFLRKEKKKSYDDLDTNTLTDNSTFWKTVKPFVADKTKRFSRIVLEKDENIISEDDEIAKIFNDYFINIPTQNIPANQEFEFLDSSKKIFL